MKTWEEMFAPFMQQGREVREGQAKLGEAIIASIDTRTSLICEASTGTGKSYAALIPMVHKALERKAAHKLFKGVVSTHTITLQTQLVDKDLPVLHSLYPGFSYRKLLGRSNYLCFNSASLATRGREDLSATYKILKTRQDNLGDGELSDMERVLKREVSKDEFEYFAGSSKFCSDNGCTKDKCYSTRARELAMIADIVVVNHALLATDIEMKVGAGGGAFADGMLGQIDVLVVDEGHKLEEVLVDQWTKKITDWELSDLTSKVLDGIDAGLVVHSHSNLVYQCVTAFDGLQDVIANIQTFYHRILMKEGKEWEGSETALSLKTLRNPSADLLAAMNEFEIENPKRLLKAEQVLSVAVKFLTDARAIAVEMEGKPVGMRPLNKGLRASKDLLESVRILSKAIATKDGIVDQFGVFGAVVEGWSRRSGEKGMTLKLTPMDVSHRAKAIWANVPANILISATLTDLTDAKTPLRFARASVGFPPGKELIVGTPFDMGAQQLVYRTEGAYPRTEGTMYSMQEFVALVNATKGRTLALFTSRRELDQAALELKQLQAQGGFPYKLYVQEKDSNKDKLAQNFKDDLNSVLLATKSFFTGFDAPGETVTQVAIMRWPLPRYSVTCRQQMTHWKKRGFHNWYEMMSLTDALQGAGRLVRSSSCKGVISILDLRSYDSSERVFKTASTGIKALGSPETSNLQEVANFVE